MAAVATTDVIGATTAATATMTAATATMTAATVITAIAIDEMWIGETVNMIDAFLTDAITSTGATMTGATLAGAITTGMSAITTVSERIEAGVAMGSARGLTVKSFKGLLLRHRLH